MIVLKNLQIEESLIKPSVTLRKDHECAYCGTTVLAGEKAIKGSFRYDDKLYPLYFHGAPNRTCFHAFQAANIYR